MMHRVGWFALLWLAGVLAVAALAFGLRTLIALVSGG